MYGIIGALDEEVELLCTALEGRHDIRQGPYCLYLGKLSGQDAVICKSGVGKVAAAGCAAVMCARYPLQALINTGAAGGIAAGMQVGDLALSTAAVQHDFDISSFPNRKKGEVAGIDLVEIKTTKWITDKILLCSSGISPIKIHTGTILSGDQFICSPQKLTELKNEFGGIACEMESGSIGQVCYVNKKEFGIIRSISDNANNSSNTDFNKFIKSSSKNAAIIMSNFIKSYRD